MNIKFFRIVVLLSTLTLTQCADDFTSPAVPSGQTITQIALGNTNLNVLVEAVTKTGLAGSLGDLNSGLFTVFAPTDDAFVSFFNSLPSSLALPPGAPSPGSFTEASLIQFVKDLQPSYPAPVPALPSGTSYVTTGGLAGIINYHIIASSLSASNLITGQGVVTMNGSRISFSRQGTNLLLNANRTGNAAGNGATVITPDVPAVNGTIHLIDKVLVPVSLANIWAGGTTGLPGFAVSYATNPPTISYSLTGAANFSVPRNSDGSLNIGAAAVSGTEYQLISLAIIRGNLAPVIIPNQTPLPDFTLFAPTDAQMISFLAVANETAARDALNALTPQAVADVVNYHLVKGRFVSTDLTIGQSIPTLRTGKNITVESISPLTLKDATNVVVSVTNGNILTNAGVLHQVGAVLKSN
jgi:transforming growth factor-beta-induced protein